ncbi:MAG: flagellar protein FliT [Caldimonas sp.]|uniref:flagellar protein FliT n=1 Tax=Caldimonas sp. TaxID=2838790 RepID=UPI00391D4672
MDDDALLDCYEAIEKASQEMLEAARSGDWDRVVHLEGACAILISRLKQVAAGRQLGPEQARAKHRVMMRILRNDAQIRHLAEPWLDELDRLLATSPRTLH